MPPAPSQEPRAESLPARRGSPARGSRTVDQSKRREELYGLLGDLPPRDRPLAATVVATEQREAYILEKLVLDLNGLEVVPAYYVRPRGGDGPFPAVLYNHAHGGAYDLGKEEFLDGRGALQSPPYAVALVVSRLRVDGVGVARRERADRSVGDDVVVAHVVLL